VTYKGEEISESVGIQPSPLDQISDLADRMIETANLALIPDSNLDGQI